MKRGIEFEVNIYLLQPYLHCFCCSSFFAENVKVDLQRLEVYTNDASFKVTRKSNLNSVFIIVINSSTKRCMNFVLYFRLFCLVLNERNKRIHNFLLSAFLSTDTCGLSNLTRWKTNQKQSSKNLVSYLFTRRSWQR